MTAGSGLKRGYQVPGLGFCSSVVGVLMLKSTLSWVSMRRHQF